jgi:hypothetical protein
VGLLMSKLELVRFQCITVASLNTVQASLSVENKARLLNMTNWRGLNPTRPQVSLPLPSRFRYYTGKEKESTEKNDIIPVQCRKEKKKNQALEEFMVDL